MRRRVTRRLNRHSNLGAKFLKITKLFKRFSIFVVWCRLFFQFTLVQYCTTFLQYANNELQANLNISKLKGLVFTSSNYPKCKLICTSGNLDLYKSPQRQIIVGESNQNVFLIHFKHFEHRRIRFIRVRISRFDCICR